jgi:hypothetical protein
MSFRNRLALLVVAAAACAGLLAGTASAHPPADFYKYKWPTTSVAYGYTPSVPTGAFRTAVDSGASQWSAVPNATLDFVHGSDFGSNFNYSTCSSGGNGIHYDAIDGTNGVLGRTFTCMDGGGNITSFQTVFDTSENWYTATGTPSGSQADLASVAAHELGHATGFGQGAPNSHFSGTICDPNSAQQTMCPAHLLGSTWQRTLEDHDQHTFAAAYPAGGPTPGSTTSTTKKKRRR